MGCNGRCNSNPCGCNEVGLPYYEDPCYQQNQTQGCKVYNQFSTVVRISTEWAVPLPGELVTLKVSALSDILIGAFLWNPSYGYFSVETYDSVGQQIKVQAVVDNTAPAGTIIPGCTKFLVTTNTAIAGIDAIQEEILVLQSEMDTVQADILTIEASIITIENNILTIQSDITTLQGDITTIEGDITTIEGDITTIEGDITAIQGDITAIQSDVNVLEGYVAQLQAALFLTLYGWVDFYLVATTYASVITFTVPGDYTSIFTKATVLKFTNSTVKYGYVGSAVFAAGTTTVTLVANTSYVLTNTTITGMQISRGTPSDFPVWFTYNIGLTGYVTPPSSIVAIFSLIGKKATVNVTMSADGVSNDTVTGMNAPIVSATGFTTYGLLTGIFNASVGSAVPGAYMISSASTALGIYKTGVFGGDPWTNSGVKRFIGTITYPI